MQMPLRKLTRKVSYFSVTKVSSPHGFKESAFLHHITHCLSISSFVDKVENLSRVQQINMLSRNSKINVKSYSKKETFFPAVSKRSPIIMAAILPKIHAKFWPPNIVTTKKAQDSGKFTYISHKALYCLLRKRDLKNF